jgi:hypothetical protein
MEHQALVTLVVVHVTTIAPNHMFNIDFLKMQVDFVLLYGLPKETK